MLSLSLSLSPSLSLSLSGCVGVGVTYFLPVDCWSAPKILKKDRLSSCLYLSPRLLEIVELVATSNIMALHAVPEQIYTRTSWWHSHLLSLSIDIHESNLLSDFQFYFLSKPEGYYKYVAHSLSLELFVTIYIKIFNISLFRNCNSNLINDHIKKINVLPHHAVPPILCKLFGTKAK